MASKTTVSDDEIQLRKRARRRLVGAIALVVLVVAAVPMVLDREPKPRTERIEVQIPPIPAAHHATAAPAVPPNPAMPAAAPAAPAEAPAAVAERAPDPQPAPLQSEPSPPPAAPSPPAAVPPAPASKATVAATAREGYVVQLIATNSPAKARELREKLARQKFPAYVEKTPDGGKLRVRVGPFETREAAEQARQRLAKLDYDPGRVVRKDD